MAQPKSIFAEQAAKQFTSYQAEIVIRDRIMGGVPRNPKIIEGWLRSKAGVTDEEEIRLMTMRTLREMGVEVDASMSLEDLMKASEAVAAERNTNGFKRDENGLYIESRQVKALLKETVNILFAGEKWGRTRKGPLNYFAERVFVEPPKIYLSRQEPDGVEMFIGHVNGPQGPRSTLGYYEFVSQPTIRFQIDVLNGDEKEQEDNGVISPVQWARIWTHAEKIGLGAVRSQGYGTFVMTGWEKMAKPF